jgi:GxxExxY protein
MAPPIRPEIKAIEPPSRQDAKVALTEVVAVHEIRRVERPLGIVPWMNTEPDEELDRLAREVIGAAIEVHRILGPGFLESVYEEALCVELRLRTIPFQRQVPVPIVYKGVAIGQDRLDLLVQGKLIVEIKTVETLAPIHKAQAISYLKATGHILALLINFNTAVLKDGIKRIVCS